MIKCSEFIFQHCVERMDAWIEGGSWAVDNAEVSEGADRGRWHERVMRWCGHAADSAPGWKVND